MRLFVAVDLAAGLRERLASIQQELRDITLPVRWVKPAGIHLTLKFIGEVPETRLAAIRAALEDVAAEGFPPISLRACGVGTFPEGGRPRVIWVGLRGDVPSAARLARSIDAALGRIGVPLEERPFRPHLTLGRVKGPGRGAWRERLQALAEIDAGPLEASCFVLFESRLGPGGAAYTPLATFAAGAGEAR